MNIYKYASVSYENSVILFGGCSEEADVDTVAQFYANGGYRWKQLGLNGLNRTRLVMVFLISTLERKLKLRRKEHAAVQIDDKIMVIGGYDLRSEFERFTVETPNKGL